MIDRLIEKIRMTKNPSVIGLDPDLTKIPLCYRQKSNVSLKDTADVIINFNCDIIDTVAPYVPAVKLQMAFYEAYGSYGVRAFEETVAYAKTKGLIVIEDAKRNDIGNTARAYANGHLGKMPLLDGTPSSVFDVDFLTVTPFLGSESIRPFVETCNVFHKGIFVLVKTSNPSAGEIQDQVTAEGYTVSEMLAHQLEELAKLSVGKYGYSSIGAVVGATYPKDAVKLRRVMKHCCFLVPGFGAQGGSADDVMPCFDEKGLGAIVNSSRGILYTHMTDDERNTITKDEYLIRVKKQTVEMQQQLYHALSADKKSMCY